MGFGGSWKVLLEEDWAGWGVEAKSSEPRRLDLCSSPSSSDSEYSQGPLGELHFEEADEMLELEAVMAWCQAGCNVRQ